MSSEPVISVQNLSKCYRIYSRPQDRLKQFLFGKFRTYFRNFWALKDISLSVAPGECVGIVGRNGAGKSTLLQVLSGILEPSGGQVAVKGRVAALLELGSGFNAEFTGRENLFIYGAILGLTREEMEAKYDEIVAFADIGEFIDQPIKTYSSGMQVRLAFAVAISVDPEILIVDEALSVGDAKFQAKCFRRFEQFREQKKTILFVTHATEQIIRHCDRAVLIDDGKIIQIGDPKDVAHTYLDLLFGSAEKTPAAPSEPVNQDLRLEQKAPEQTSQARFDANKDLLPSRKGYNRAEFRWGDGRAQIVDCRLFDSEGRETVHLSNTEPITVILDVFFTQQCLKPIYGLTIKSPDGVTIYGSNSRDAGSAQFTPQSPGSTAQVTFKFVPKLVSGHYLLSLGVAEQSADEVIPLDRRYDVVEVFVANPGKAFGITDLEMVVDIVQESTKEKTA